MTRKLLYLSAIIFVLTTFNSCDSLFDNCSTCAMVTYEDGVEINTSNETNYCGDELIRIKATPAVTTGNTVTKWECE